MADDERCWYCLSRKAELWCDYMLGSTFAPAEPQQLALELTPWDGRKNLQTELPAVEHVATCDAAACLSCARRHGWIRKGHVCARPASRSSTIDHCHVHARSSGLGSAAWMGLPAIEVLRRDVRAACVRAAARAV
jgi:hypothetical protein